MNKQFGDRIIAVANAVNDMMEKITPGVLDNPDGDNADHMKALAASRKAFPSYWEDAEKYDYDSDALVDSITEERLKIYEEEEKEEEA